MFAILSKLIPFRDYVYGAVILTLIIAYNVHVHNLIVADEHKRDAAVAVASARVEAQAQAKIASLNKQYADQRAADEETHAKQIQVDADVHAADLQRLRQLAAKSSGGTSLGGSTSTSTPTSPGDDSLIRLGYVSEELAAALRDARSDLGQCYAERDSLTGK